MIQMAIGFLVGFLLGIIVTVFAAILAFDNGYNWAEKRDKKSR